MAPRAKRSAARKPANNFKKKKGSTPSAKYAYSSGGAPAERVGPAGWKEGDIRNRLSQQPQGYDGEDIGKITNAIINGTVKRGRRAAKAKRPAAKRSAKSRARKK